MRLTFESLLTEERFLGHKKTVIILLSPRAPASLLLRLDIGGDGVANVHHGAHNEDDIVRVDGRQCATAALEREHLGDLVFFEHGVLGNEAHRARQALVPYQHL